jgi:hypothetical protein
MGGYQRALQNVFLLHLEEELRTFDRKLAKMDRLIRKAQVAAERIGIFVRPRIRR